MELELFVQLFTLIERRSYLLLVVSPAMQTIERKTLINRGKRPRDESHLVESMLKQMNISLTLDQVQVHRTNFNGMPFSSSIPRVCVQLGIHRTNNMINK